MDAGCYYDCSWVFLSLFLLGTEMLVKPSDDSKMWHQRKVCRVGRVSSVRGR